MVSSQLGAYLGNRISSAVHTYYVPVYHIGTIMMLSSEYCCTRSQCTGMHVDVNIELEKQSDHWSDRTSLLLVRVEIVRADQS